jgi:hypothetical protein
MQMKWLFQVAVVCLPALAGAQSESQAPITQRDSVSQAVQSVDSGSILRVRTSRLTTRGTLAGSSDNALVLATPSGTLAPIRFDAIEEVWKQGHYAKRGAIIGGVTGATLLTTFGLLLISGLCEQVDGCSNDYPTVALYGIGIGGGGGALVGGGLGYLAKRWIKVY